MLVRLGPQVQEVLRCTHEELTPWREGTWGEWGCWWARYRSGTSTRWSVGATVDAYGEDEELAGFHAVLTDRLALPFNTWVLGVDVVVEDLDLRPGTGVVALCRHGAHRQAIGLLDLPLPDPPPQGFEWIEAFRRWAP